MNGEMEIYSGVTLGWALFSLAIGILIVLVVVVRVGLDFRRRKVEKSPNDERVPVGEREDEDKGEDDELEDEKIE